MKRFHVHVRVEDLAQSVRFYSTLFATEPTVLKDDYAKWMLDDPRVNFAISTHCGETAGISHLGIQAEDEAELGAVYERLARADRPVVEEMATTCCYAVSDKQWVADPQGVKSETFFIRIESRVKPSIGSDATSAVAASASRTAAPSTRTGASWLWASPQPRPSG